MTRREEADRERRAWAGVVEHLRASPTRVPKGSMTAALSALRAAERAAEAAGYDPRRYPAYAETPLEKLAGALRDALNGATGEEVRMPWEHAGEVSSVRLLFDAGDWASVVHALQEYEKGAGERRGGT